MCICRQQPFQYRAIIDLVAGGIFLGAPHLVNDKLEAKKVLCLLLKCQRKGIGRNLKYRNKLEPSAITFWQLQQKTQLIDDDVDALMDVCKSFELLNLRVPVVSVYESKETSTHDLVPKFRRDQVVCRAYLIHHFPI